MLIDPGATHEFVARGFASNSEHELGKLPEAMVITTPMEDHYVAEHVYRECEVKIRGHRFQIDLIPA